jgi:hypothetical protein
LNTKIYPEICNIYNYINSKKYKDGSSSHRINSFEEYHNNIEKVSDIILKTSVDFDITLKNKMSDNTKIAIKSMFGQDYLNYMLKGE